ncbi:MAG TPA: hypothetical protein VEC57_04285 [Candidatus Limnocylindrales bacterium]|nr:hypothetical protein [Candidatus Limnocylindrales bacterium]
MTAVFAVLIILTVAALIAAPLLQAGREVAFESGGRGELWRREKAVALMAISEADFDRATGKLSDDDYRVLRHDYEGRAVRAMDELDELDALVPQASAGGGAPSFRFCPSCGRAFAEPDRFCAGCGHARA